MSWILQTVKYANDIILLNFYVVYTIPMGYDSVNNIYFLFSPHPRPIAWASETFLILNNNNVVIITIYYHCNSPIYFFTYILSFTANAFINISYNNIHRFYTIYSLYCFFVIIIIILCTPIAGFGNIFNALVY